MKRLCLALALFVTAMAVIIYCGGSLKIETGRGCYDGLDNDHDGVIDCEDSDCRNLTICGGSIDSGPIELPDGALPGSSDSSSDAEAGAAASTCSDGTALNTCSVRKPLYCNSKGQLVSSCEVCQCLGNASCDIDSQTCGAGQLDLKPIIDAYVDADQPSVNFGASDDLFVGYKKDTGAYRITYLQFDLRALGSNVTMDSAQLNLVSKVCSSLQGRVEMVGASWEEGKINWDNKPGNYSNIFLPVDLNSSPLSGNILELIKNCLPGKCFGLRVIATSSEAPDASCRLYSRSDDHNYPKLSISFH